MGSESVPPAFQNWKQELEKKAYDAGSKRRQEEARLQKWKNSETTAAVLGKYPYKEVCQVQQSWQELREQLVKLIRGIRNREEGCRR